MYLFIYLKTAALFYLSWLCWFSLFNDTGTSSLGVISLIIYLLNTVSFTIWFTRMHSVRHIYPFPWLHFSLRFIMYCGLRVIFLFGWEIFWESGGWCWFFSSHKNIYFEWAKLFNKRMMMNGNGPTNTKVKNLFSFSDVNDPACYAITFDYLNFWMRKQ